MRALASSACVELWERGRRLHSLDRGLLALSFWLPDVTPETLADWPLGRRNQALLEVYCSRFGSHLESWTTCDSCGEKMELDLDAEDFLEQRGKDAGFPATVAVGDQTFRPPTSRDLAHIVRHSDPQPDALRLLERCRISAGNIAGLSQVEIEEIEEQMASADPLSEIRLSLCCPTCNREWEEPLDPVDFLWAEIETCGKRLLWEVHTLASAYGWTEAEVFSLGESRRSLYLDMISEMVPGAGREVASETFSRALAG